MYITPPTPDADVHEVNEVLEIDTVYVVSSSIACMIEPLPLVRLTHSNVHPSIDVVIIEEVEEEEGRMVITDASTLTEVSGVEGVIVSEVRLSIPSD